MRCDRVGLRGGGVCIFVKRNFQMLKNERTPTRAGIQLVCFDLLRCDVVYRFFVVYRPPTSTDGDGVKLVDTMSQLVTCLANNLNKHGPDIILGDFNCPNIDWQTMMCPSEINHNALRDFVVFNGFIQCVLSPTTLSSILDIVLVSDPMLVSNIEILPSFSTSDHNLVEVEFLYSVSAEACAPQALTKRFQWNRGDYDGLCDYLSVYDWTGVIFLRIISLQTHCGVVFVMF